jgi:hypothetical protein
MSVLSLNFFIRSAAEIAFEFFALAATWFRMRTVLSEDTVITKIETMIITSFRRDL